MQFPHLPISSHPLFALRPIEGLLRSYRMVRGQPGDFKMYAHVVK